MNTIKIVTKTQYKTEEVEYYSGFERLVVYRGVFTHVDGAGPSEDLVPNPGLCVDTLNNAPAPVAPDRFVGDSLDEGTPCKLLMLDYGRGKEFLTIATPSTVYVLGDNGKTVDTLH
jgi:hypothetical protein